MPRAVNEKVSEAEKLYKSGMPLADIAKKLELPAGTVRRWKSANKWGSERSESNERSRKNSERSESAIEQLDKSNLTDKQKLFCIYYVKYFNATKAYQKAYESSYTVANAEGYKLLVKPCIRDEITRLKQNRLNREMISPEDIFQKFMDIAFADVTDYLSFGQEEVQCMGPFGPLFIKDKKTGKTTPVTKVVNSVRFKESGDVDGSNLTIQDFQNMWETAVKEALRVCSILGPMYKITGATQLDPEKAAAIDWGDGVLFDRTRTWQEYNGMVAAGLLKPELAIAWYFDLPTPKTPKDFEKIRAEYMPDMEEQTGGTPKGDDA